MGNCKQNTYAFLILDPWFNLIWTDANSGYEQGIHIKYNTFLHATPGFVTNAVW